jgi:hypothetical protein
MKQHFGGKVFSGRMIEAMKVLWLHYNMAVKMEDLQLYPVNLERALAFHFMT